MFGFQAPTTPLPAITAEATGKRGSGSRFQASTIGYNGIGGSTPRGGSFSRKNE